MPLLSASSAVMIVFCFLFFCRRLCIKPENYKPRRGPRLHLHNAWIPSRPPITKIRVPWQGINYLKLLAPDRIGKGRERKMKISFCKEVFLWKKMKHGWKINEIQWSIRDYFNATPPYCSFRLTPDLILDGSVLSWIRLPIRYLMSAENKVVLNSELLLNLWMN